MALANLDLFEKDHIVEGADRRGVAFRAVLDGLRDLPIVGDVRGDGYFYGIELVKDKVTKQSFDDDESERLFAVTFPRPCTPPGYLPSGRPGRPCYPAGAPFGVRAGALRPDR